MLADAERHTTREAPQRAAVLKPCRFCGEAEHLQVHPGYHCDNDQFVWAEGAKIARGPTGEPLYQHDDGVECLVCNATAPRIMWQADTEALRGMRAATLAAWPEYDDAGAWQGRVQ